jgi:hypothetical protein
VGASAHPCQGNPVSFAQNNSVWAAWAFRQLGGGTGRCEPPHCVSDDHALLWQLNPTIDYLFVQSCVFCKLTSASGPYILYIKTDHIPTNTSDVELALSRVSVHHSNLVPIPVALLRLPATLPAGVMCSVGQRIPVECCVTVIIQKGEERSATEP